MLPVPSISTVGSITPVPFRALVAWVWVTPGAAMVHSVPPLNSIPRFSPPRSTIEMMPSRMMAVEMLNQISPPAHEVEAGLAPVEPGDRAVTPPGLGQEGTGGVVEADELLLVEVLRVDALLELLDVLLADVVEGAAVAARSRPGPSVSLTSHHPLRRPRPEPAVPVPVALHRARWRC